MRVNSRGIGELLRVSSLKAFLLSSIGFIATLWVCSVSAQVTTTTVLKQQVVAFVVKVKPELGRNAQGVNRSLTNVIVESGHEWVEAAFVAPGDKLLDLLKVKNNGQHTVPIGHLWIEDKVPQGSILAPESFLQTDILNAFSVSADGQQFVAASSAVGPAGDWRWLRGEHLKSLEPGQSLNLFFQARLQDIVDP